MKDGLIHLCFIIDESGSMHGSEADVVGGFDSFITEQKKVEDGECLVSVFRFANLVTKDFIGKPLDEIEPLQYKTGGCTAMNDGIGAAIDEIGKWLSDIDESERPSKNMIVIMTDGEENSSREYSLQQVKDMIKHQEEKYNWSFVYMGSDINSLNDARALGITYMSVSSKNNIIANYSTINDYAVKYRCSNNTLGWMEAERDLSSKLLADTETYEAQTGITV